MVCKYHVEEECEYKVLATNEVDAARIAEMMFTKAHTPRCILDNVEQAIGQT